MVVFPAYAGMFLITTETGVFVMSFPRVCGDVSLDKSLTEEEAMFSPRMRGCFQASDEHTSNESVFPAYAGMFQYSFQPAAQSRSFPRVCGDVSLYPASRQALSRFSPRMRGCFSDDEASKEN